MGQKGPFSPYVVEGAREDRRPRRRGTEARPGNRPIPDKSGQIVGGREGKWGMGTAEVGTVGVPFGRAVRSRGDDPEEGSLECIRRAWASRGGGPPRGRTVV